MLDKLTIKQADKSDLHDLLHIAQRMKDTIMLGYHEQCLDLQELGERDVFMAYYDGQLCGYVMLSYTPKYAYYRAHNMPEIQDLNVLPEFRQRGIGRAMIEYCENLARDKNYKKMGIGVGLTPSYGAAQRLYVRLGYVPDGMGVTFDRKVVRHGERHPIDDDISLMMEKTL